MDLTKVELNAKMSEKALVMCELGYQDIISSALNNSSWTDEQKQNFIQEYGVALDFVNGIRNFYYNKHVEELKKKGNEK